jgi:endonuclease/exonuclease/phosphatase (EEP) superfamily protein YafD
MIAVLLRVAVIGGLLGGLAVTFLGMLVDRWPFLELLNHFRPVIVICAIALAGLALLTQRRPLVITAVLIALANIALFGSALQGFAAAPSAGNERFIRVVTYNMWLFNRKLSHIAQFINAANADFAVLQEVLPWQREKLHMLIQERYPYVIGDSDVVIYSKHPPLENEQLEAPKFQGYPRRSMILWATFDVKGVMFDLAGLHLAYPFNPREQAADMPKLTEFARERERPLIIAGDFNLTPWSVKLQRFTQESGLKRFNTFIPTWPMNKLRPFVAIDNIFASPEFAAISVEAGPPIGSDHRPLVADVALTRQVDETHITRAANYP